MAGLFPPNSSVEAIEPMQKDVFVGIKFAALIANLLTESTLKNSVHSTGPVSTGPPNYAKKCRTLSKSCSRPRSRTFETDLRIVSFRTGKQARRFIDHSPAGHKNSQ